MELVDFFRILLTIVQNSKMMYVCVMISQSRPICRLSIVASFFSKHKSSGQIPSLKIRLRMMDVFFFFSLSLFLVFYFYFFILHSGPPVISSFEPNPTNATENQRTQIECYGQGLPLPSFSITKVKPAPGMICGLYTESKVKMAAYRPRLSGL